MRWRFRKLHYDILVPKLGKHIHQLDETEAAAYFEWFMEKVPERVDYVSSICARELGVPKEKLNCTPESLVLLWKWFLRRAKTEAVIKTKKDESVEKFLDNIWTNKRQLTLETEYIIRDIGMYLGETFTRNNKNLYWTYYTKPRRDFFVNYPLLKGFVDRSFGQPFEAVFEPVHMVGVQAAKILSKKPKEMDLFNVYDLWSKKL